MLNPFPQLLIFGFFAPTLLRIAVATTFAYWGIHTWRHTQHLAHVPLPIIGARAWMPHLAATAEILLTMMFLVGWYTQIAALLGFIGMIKYFIYRQWSPRTLEYLPASTGTALLIGIICLSLLISGAGAFAFDLPL